MMKTFYLFVLSCLFMLAVPKAEAAGDCSGLLDFTVRELASDQSVRLCDVYRDKVLLIVNTASKCGFTPQYEGLEKLYSDYKAQGFAVLGFPSNDFGGQEPGNEHQVKKFCALTYSVGFPMFAKSSVRKGSAIPLYQALAKASGEYPQWNFHKYLIDRNGHLVSAFPSAVAPQDARLIKALTGALAVPAAVPPAEDL